MKKVLSVSILSIFIFIVVACTLQQQKPTYKFFALSKITVETIVSQAKLMNKQGNLSDEDLLKIRNFYDKAREANNTVIDTLITALDAGIQPDSSPDYTKALIAYNEILKEFLNLAVDLNLIKRGTK